MKRRHGEYLLDLSKERWANELHIFRKSDSNSTKMYPGGVVIASLTAQLIFCVISTGTASVLSLANFPGNSKCLYGFYLEEPLAKNELT